MGASRILQGGSANDPKSAYLSNLIGSGLTFAEMRAASPLTKDAQLVIDNSVVKVGTQRLTVTSDLMALGLTYSLPNPLSILEIQWDSIGETGGAQRTMTPSARGQNQLPARLQRRLPVYLTTDDFFMGIRTLRASERVGTPLDTSLIEQATRRVNEAIEDSVINGATLETGTALQVNSNTVPGLLNAPNVNTYTIPVNWNTATGEQILADVLNMIGALQADKKYGPYLMYVGTNIGNALNKEFKAGTSGSTLARLQQVSNGTGGMLSIKVADMMPSDTVLMFQATSDVIDLVVGQAPTVVPWTSPDGFTLYWMVMGIVIPRVRSDYNNASGIVVGKPA
jgi:uncharacterized linocin/CFP29 family protein